MNIDEERTCLDCGKPLSKFIYDFRMLVTGKEVKAYECLNYNCESPIFIEEYDK